MAAATGSRADVADSLLPSGREKEEEEKEEEEEVVLLCCCTDVNHSDAAMVGPRPKEGSPGYIHPSKYLFEYFARAFGVPVLELYVRYLGAGMNLRASFASLGETAASAPSLAAVFFNVDSPAKPVRYFSPGCPGDLAKFERSVLPEGELMVIFTAEPRTVQRQDGVTFVHSSETRRRLLDLSPPSRTYTKYYFRRCNKTGALFPVCCCSERDFKEAAHYDKAEDYCSSRWGTDSNLLAALASVLSSPWCPTLAERDGGDKLFKLALKPDEFWQKLGLPRERSVLLVALRSCTHLKMSQEKMVQDPKNYNFSYLAHLTTPTSTCKVDDVICVGITFFQPTPGHYMPSLYTILPQFNRYLLSHFLILQT